MYVGYEFSLGTAVGASNNFDKSYVQIFSNLCGNFFFDP